MASFRVNAAESLRVRLTNDVRIGTDGLHIVAPRGEIIFLSGDVNGSQGAASCWKPGR